MTADSRLRESLELLLDPALREAVTVPWSAIGLVVMGLMLGALVLLRLRRPKPAKAPIIPPIAPPEDALAALEAAWVGAAPDRLIETIEAMNGVLRRFLGRRLQRDLDTSTTPQLAALCAGLPHFSELHTHYYMPGDVLRYSGMPLAIADVRVLYEAARDFVKKSQLGLSSTPRSRAGSPPCESVPELDAMLSSG